jgi:secondary thiamine-phosphate synthase enzyme
MPADSHVLKIQTHHEGELVDLTEQVQNIVGDAKFSGGVAFLFVPGSTAALTTIEYEPGLAKDFPAALDRLVPRTFPYEHENSWHDGNGHSHVKAALLGPDLAVPFQNRRLSLGTWQQIVFVELDVRPRDRTVIVQLLGN